MRFVSFPPVLNLQLKRFEFDPITCDMVKINDRFEFPERLDLDPFLTAQEPAATMDSGDGAAEAAAAAAGPPPRNV